MLNDPNIIYVPPKSNLQLDHTCNLPLSPTGKAPLKYPIGAVWRCPKCIKTWVVKYYVPSKYLAEWESGKQWEPESRFAKWRRQRKTGELF